METEHARLRDEQVAEIEKLKFRVAALEERLGEFASKYVVGARAV